MQIYVGNLPQELTDEELRRLFEAHGTVRAAAVGRDKKTGASQGYGFVDMPVKAEARAAVEALRGKDVGGKTLRVKVLKPGDDFHQHALDLQKTGRRDDPASRPSGQFRGDVGYRASGAIRRGGQRGS